MWVWDFKFSRRRVWCSELSSGIYCRVKWLSTDVSEVSQKTTLNICGCVCVGQLKECTVTNRRNGQNLFQCQMLFYVYVFEWIKPILRQHTRRWVDKLPRVWQFSWTLSGLLIDTLVMGYYGTSAVINGTQRKLQATFGVTTRITNSNLLLVMLSYSKLCMCFLSTYIEYVFCVSLRS
jgi:hypothetical protein